MKKLLTILGSVAMVATTGAVAVACKTATKPDKPVVAKQKLTDLVKVTTGIVVTDTDKDNVEKVVEAVNAKNADANLVASELEVTTVKGNKLKLSAKENSTKYEGSVEIQIIVEPTPVAKQKLTDLVKVKTGIVVTDTDKDNVEKVVEAVNAKNADANLVASELEVTTVKGNKLKLSAKENSTKYEGSVEIQIFPWVLRSL